MNAKVKNDTLNLTLKKEFFDQILSGEKKEEFREVKPYWIKRLFFVNEYYYQSKTSSNLYYSKLKGWDTLEELMEEIIALKIEKPFTKILFRNGYSKDAPEFEIELKQISLKKDIDTPLGKGNFLVLSLGDLINKKHVA